MSDTFIGIENENEFFTQHYLAAILSGDLKPLLAEWREQAAERRAETGGAARTPPAALGAQHLEFFRFRERAGRLKARELRVEAHREVWAGLLGALGYSPHRSLVSLPEGQLPLLATVERPDGAPLLWVLPVAGEADDDRSTLSRSVLQAQVADVPRELAEEPAVVAPGTVEELVTAAFSLDEPPRFVLVCGETDLYLLERAKWAEQRLLRFDLEEVLGRRDSDTLDVAAALLHRDCLAPDSGAALLDTLDDNSHKHAFEVSEDLKYALQACIERLGNEAITQIRAKQRDQKKRMVGADEAEQLSRECLRYMYRLLFLFYIEARPELGYAPMGSDAYRLGYSLERLRDLEQLDLQTDEARQGSYIHDSLQLLFAMIHDGADPYAYDRGLFRQVDRESLHGTFRVEPLRSHLFDPARTPLLNGVSLPNEVLRDVLEWMSLSRGGAKQGKKKARRRGRISYATLGINQLGAVYEALLSYRGFFAESDLYEVKPAKQKGHDVLKTAYFVPEDEIEPYTEDERVYEDDGVTLKRYPAGTFIYRLAGRDRQTSASYYTPEVLTRCLVKYALKELLEDEKTGELKLTADAILATTVCEPAMGSAAFLNEAVNQLAEAYLQAKQKELGERIPHDRYGHEKQRVKMYLADNNVFGVDLNPVAVELAEVSLWLNTIHEGGFVPWFGGQTACGNSLIGARRQVFTKAEVRAGKEGKRTDWLDAVPRRVKLGERRPKGSVFHFLLGDRGMSVYGQGNEGKPIRELAGEALDAIEAWRAGFNTPVEDDDWEAMVALSDAADRLWRKHVELLRKIRRRTTDPLPVYGRLLAPGTSGPTTTAEKDAIWEQEMESKEVRAASPYRRLKLVMDYWCALWFWPIEQAELLPDRDEYLADLALLLDTNVLSTLQGDAQRSLFAPTMPADEAKALAQELGIVDVDKLVSRNDRLRLVVELGKRYRILHWELEFADLFADRGGFDLMLGNPPWIRVQWSEKDVLGDVDPAFVLKKLSATQTTERREQTFERYQNRPAYLAAHEAATGTQAFLSARQNYPELRGIKVNLYKCFLPVVWRTTNADGVSGLLHPEKVYDEPSGGHLREALYPRLRRHYQFYNELKLFPIGHTRPFSINIYGASQAEIRFATIANLFAPSGIDSCHAHIGGGRIPGMKEGGTWCSDGHHDRIIEVGASELRLFAKIYDEPGTPWQAARLPALHAVTMLTVLKCFAEATTLGEPGARYRSTDMWNETRAKRSGIIKEKTGFAATALGLILSGPHFSVGNPLYKTPRRGCTGSLDYDVVDLVELCSTYLPRTNFVPACSPAEYRIKTPAVPWVKGEKRRVTAFYRLVSNRAMDPRVERTLKAAIAPKQVGHIHGVYSYAFADTRSLLATAAAWMALPVDFLLKTTGAADFVPNLARRLPVANAHVLDLEARSLVLNCVSGLYGELWRTSFRHPYTTATWAKRDPRLPDSHFSTLGASWTWDTPLRTDYARRQALVEIDVLVSMGLGLTLEQLQTLYRAQFYVLRQNEEDTWFDRNGRIVFTCSKGLVGVGLPRKKAKSHPRGPYWNDVKDMTSGTVEHTVTDDTLPGGPRERTIVYEAPFDRCDREQDYAVVWKHFEKRFAGEQA